MLMPGRGDGAIGTAARVVLGAVVALLLLGAAAAVAQARTERVVEGVELDGEAVGGMTRDELEQVAQQRAEEAAGATVRVTGVREEVEAARADIGVTYDAQDAVERVWSLGRRDPVRTLLDHGRVLLGRTIEVRTPEERDEDAITRWAEEAAEILSVPPRPAGIELDTGEQPPDPDDPASRAQVIEPLPGEEVSADELRSAVEERLAATRGAVEIDSPGQQIEPAADERDLEAALPDARAAVSAPVVLTNPSPGSDVVLEVPELARILEVRREEDDEPGRRLRLVADAERLVEVLGEGRIEAANAEPVDASFEIVDGAPEVRGGTRGYRFDAQTVADQLPAVAAQPSEDGETRTAELDGERPAPDLTREEAEELGIEERVSSFTTNYSCCPPRVTNIRRAANILSGAIIRPGQTFSLDEHLGPRTSARGFVSAGVIIDGEFEDELGGGISQLATTFFNAAFFSGVRILDHQPHSYYISRYPMGRESTISRGVIDVVIENDSPYGILVTASAGSNGVTVSFWSTEWAEVEAWSSGPYNRRSGAVRDGFDITYGRTVTYPDGSTDEDEWFHRYQPED